jgi:hypothetical protein
VAPAYEKLWTGAFAGGARPRSARARLARRWFDASSMRDRTAARRRQRPSPQLRLALALAGPLEAAPSANVVVKSVQACCAVEWIEAKFSPRVVVVNRHPLNALASWKEYGFGANPDMAEELAGYAERSWDLHLAPEKASRFARQVMSFGVLVSALHDAAARHPDWIVVHHEELVLDPAAQFRALAERVGLEFSDEAAAYLRESDQKGEGYATKRDREGLRSKWRRVLTEDDVRIARDVFEQFPERFGLSAELHEREHLG